MLVADKVLLNRNLPDIVYNLQQQIFAFLCIMQLRQPLFMHRVNMPAHGTGSSGPSRPSVAMFTM
jgi:hypothetical protein